MALMDEATSDKKNQPTEQQLKDFARILHDLFSVTSTDLDFKKRFDIAVARDSKLAAEVSELRSTLSSLI